MGKKIATVVTDLFEDVEFTSPKYALTNVGHQVITIEKKAGDTVTGKKEETSITIDKGIDAAKKPIFSICHGPQLLINAEVFKGKRMTAIKQVGVDLKNAGSLFEDSEVVEDESGIISSRTPEDLPSFNKVIVNALAK